MRHRFDHSNFLWCPRHKDTPRQFECTRLITAEHVKATIKRIPGFGVHKAPAPVAAKQPEKPAAAEKPAAKSKKKQGR